VCGALLGVCFGSLEDCVDVLHGIGVGGFAILLDSLACLPGQQRPDCQREQAGEDRDENRSVCLDRLRSGLR